MKLSTGALSALLLASASQAFLPASLQSRGTKNAAFVGVHPQVVARTPLRPSSSSIWSTATDKETDKETYEFTVRMLQRESFLEPLFGCARWLSHHTRLACPTTHHTNRATSVE